MTLSFRMRDLRITIALCSTLLLVACLQPYRMEIQQGNLFDQNTLDQVKVGMTKKQVRFLLGTPLVNDPFHANRWDYFYSLYSHDKKISERYQISVVFSEKGCQRDYSGSVAKQSHPSTRNGTGQTRSFGPSVENSQPV